MVKEFNRIKSNAVDGSYFITGLKPGMTYEIRFSDFDYMSIHILFKYP